MKVEYAKNPIWANSENTVINLTVKFYEFNEELPFSASPQDCEAHGREIYQNAIAGEYGVVLSYVPPPSPTTEELALQARQRRNSLLGMTDWTQAADVPQAIKDIYTPYRQLLRDVPLQSGFPLQIVWPVKPE